MTREQIQARLDAYVAAEIKILGGQEYTVGDGATARRLRRADLSEVRVQIDVLRNQLAAMDAAAGSVRRVMYVR